MLDYLETNESNVRNIHQMVHDLKEEMNFLQMKTSRIETRLEKIMKLLKE